ncbi:MAG: hypothetical protein HC888_04670 [Candidatus Competibacteraceae bacterium]|nr:hypothetical protein [Candidatus Competibacteraceae bacterium]
MTTAQAIVDQAFREGQLVPVGASPTTDERTEGLGRLNAFIKSLIGFDLGELTVEWQVPPRSTSPVSARYPLEPVDEKLPDDVWPYPPPNVTLSTKISSATTIYLDQSPCDGARVRLADAGSSANLTINANGRTIEAAATITVTPASDAPREWIYRKDKSDWVRLSTLSLDDTVPFPEMFDDLLITGLAIRLAPRNGQATSKDTYITYNAMLRKFKAHYKQARRMPSDYDLRMQTKQAYETGFGRGNLLR